MSKVVVQIPMDKKIRDSAAKAVQELGLSSLQEAFRIYAKKLAERKISINITEVEYLSPEAEKRYTKMDEDFKKGVNVKGFKGVDELMEDLAS
jgi:antitoxin component of RelBE/YafQ-DinJ toxin-antitoxin module